MGKVSIQELAALLVDRAGLNKKEATTFIGAIFDLVQQALETEKIVKIKGLGTFKIIDVDDRESVNVNTGERVLIEGHGKITFAPDSIIKELVNKPFSQFDTVVLNDGVDFDDDLPPESPQNSEPVLQPVIEPVLKPVVKPASQPIVRPASQPIVEPVSQPEPAPVFQTKVSQEEPTEMPLVDFVDERQAEENLSESEAPSGDLPKSEATSVAFKTPEPESEPQAAPGLQPESESENSEDELEQESQEEVEEETEEVEERFGVNKWLLALLACILGIIIGYFIGNYFPMNSNQGGEEAKVEKVVPAKKTVVKPAVTPEAAAPAENADKTAEEVMQPEPEPKPEVKPEIKPEVKPEAKPVIKPEAKPEVKPEAKAAPKPVTKPEPKAPKAEEKKPAAKESAPEKLDKYSAMDARVRTGAYRIVGTEKVVKVKEGDNLRKISNRVLGPDMECYLEVYNGMKVSTPLKVGQEIKVPKLQLKKKKKPQTVN